MDILFHCAFLFSREPSFRFNWEIRCRKMKQLYKLSVIAEHADDIRMETCCNTSEIISPGELSNCHEISLTRLFLSFLFSPVE